MDTNIEEMGGEMLAVDASADGVIFGSDIFDAAVFRLGETNPDLVIRLGEISDGIDASENWFRGGFPETPLQKLGAVVDILTNW